MHRNARSCHLSTHHLTIIDLYRLGEIVTVQIIIMKPPTPGCTGGQCTHNACIIRRPCMVSSVLPRTVDSQSITMACDHHASLTHDFTDDAVNTLDLAWHSEIHWGAGPSHAYLIYYDGLGERSLPRQFPGPKFFSFRAGLATWVRVKSLPPLNDLFWSAT